MRVLLVIHGYPARYNAGSEVYSQSLARALSEAHEVRVFTRQENPFLPQYAVSDEADPGNARVRLCVVNNPGSRDRYRHDEIDAALDRVINEFEPDVVHVNHVNHLSTSLLETIRSHGLPLVYTLHDFWLMCPRGQFIHRSAQPGEEPYPLCCGQDDRKCAQRCYSLYFSGGAAQREADTDRWAEWVHERMDHVREMAAHVDVFIAPSKYVLERYRDEFGIPEARLAFVDYGFDLSRLSGRSRVVEPEFVFGYIGTHIPPKTP